MIPELLQERPSHVGLVVTDLEASLERLRRLARWVEMEPVAVPFRVGDGDGMTLADNLRLAWACLGELHVELIEALDGTPWSRELAGGLHHIGWWVDDVAAGSDQLRVAGLSCEAADWTADGRPRHFAYHRHAVARVEVSSARRGAEIRRLCGPPPPGTQARLDGDIDAIVAGATQLVDHVLRVS